MATVIFPDFLWPLTGGLKDTEVGGERYRDLVEQLDSRFPGIAERLEKTAVAIDGQIHQDAYLEPLEPDSEVVFMPRIEGG
ncbi:MAG: MoaD/ThiS family protein [Pseudomonadaceae bacterium]|nr:MoaD/ThiS family protein [Pseudomonadaceae bacterium]